MGDYKFRGKRVDNGEWVYGDLVHSRTKVSSVIFDDEGFGRAVDPETITPTEAAQEVRWTLGMNQKIPEELLPKLEKKHEPDPNEVIPPTT
jgi:hypothetical protein